MALTAQTHTAPAPGSFHEQFVAALAAKGIKVNTGSPVRVPAAVPQRTVRAVDVVRAELQAASAGFDSAYEYADDHTTYCRGRDQWARISALRAELLSLEAAQ